MSWKGSSTSSLSKTGIHPAWIASKRRRVHQPRPRSWRNDAKNVCWATVATVEPLVFAWETNETSEKDFDLGCTVWEKITGQTCSQADSRHKNPTQTACQFFQPSIHSSYIQQLLQLRAKQPRGTRQKCEFPMRKL